ncbi:MAG: serine/threonine protein kinase [Myxococcales bacterium]|nr:serine/threonine protein kinase [Myxococcales bacterium]MCB9732783.1 serine/threonine protein kinase [Deltaproteobacteria bacterium]
MEVQEPRPGEIIGHNYIIESELGRGGFGVVFKARHLDIDRVVALKVLLATYARKDPSAVDRFRREATIAASLDYPNTVRVFDYGETDDGVFYLIMEFVQGKDLTHVIAREGRLGVRRSIHVVRQVLHAMMEAHSRGIVHRDIKPDNIMLVPLGYDPEFVKVMDFGIAKMVHGGESLTQAGITLGTPRYMPIEQLKGAELTPATDLYATGLVLYEMLMGIPAFTGDTAVDVAVSVMESPTLKVPPSAGLAPEIAAIIEKACAKDASERFQSAREFLNALNHLDPKLLDIDPREETLDRRLDPPGLRAETEGGRQTMLMPGLEGGAPGAAPTGDVEDATKTVALEASVAIREAEAARGFHGAATQAMPVLEKAKLVRKERPPAATVMGTAMGAEAAPDAAAEAAAEAAAQQSLEEVAAALADAVARRPSAIYLILHVVTLVLLLLVLVRLLS